METTRKLLAGIFDIIWYWVPNLWISLLNTIKFGVPLFLGSYGLLIVIATLSVYLRGGTFSIVFPEGFWDVFKLFLLGYFLVIIMWSSASANRRLTASIEPFRFLWIRKYNPRESDRAVGLSITNFNQSEISRIHGVIKRITKDSKTVTFSEKDAVLVGSRYAKRATTQYTDANQIRLGETLFVEIAQQKSKNTGEWLTNDETALAKLPQIDSSSKLTVIVKINVHSTAGSHLVYQEYELDIGFVSGVLKVKGLVRI